MKLPDPRERLSWVQSSENIRQLAQRYDAWAEEYDQDLSMYGGKRFSSIMAESTCRYVKPGDGLLLDACACTGALGDILGPLGYKEIVGIDLSKGMLKVARRKGLYKELRQMALGQHLDFPDDTFAAFTVTAVLREKHIRPDSLDELVRVTRPGGYGMFSIVDDGYLNSGFKDKQDSLEREGKWELVEVTDLLQVGAAGQGGGSRRGFVYRVS